MDLKNLDTYNKEMRELYHRINTYPQLNGLACPECGAELWDSDAVILTSYPPKKNVHCTGCDYTGYKVA